MPTPLKTFEKFVALFDSIVYQPSRRWLTDADILNYAQLALLETALEVDGIHYIDTSIITVSGTATYTTPNNIKRIKKAHYIKNIGTAEEEAAIIEVISQRDSDFLSGISAIGDAGNSGSPFFAAATADSPRFLIYSPASDALKLIDTPSRDNDRVRLWCLGIPNEIGPGIVYDGDQMETMAIVYKMASLARVKSRETQESSFFDNKFVEACSRVRRMRSRMRQVRQVQDGRFTRTRLRSVDGAK